MEKYKKLIEQKNNLEQKIAVLCNKFTESTGLIIKRADMSIDVEEDKSNIEKYKIKPDYTININCEI